MKGRRLLTGILFLFCTMILNAKHLEFMGIPINGTISNFQTKLQAKGCKIHKFNSSVPTGVRAFTGTFAGEDCQIFVYYNKKNQKVYRVRAVTESTSSIESAKSEYHYFKNLLDRKYVGRALTADMLEDYDENDFEYSWAVIEEPVQEGAELLGSIYLEILDLDEYVDDYAVAITYEDFENSDVIEQDVLDDL